MNQPSSLNKNVQIYSADHIDGQPRRAKTVLLLQQTPLKVWENVLGVFEAVKMKVLSHMSQVKQNENACFAAAFPKTTFAGAYSYHLRHGQLT